MDRFTDDEIAALAARLRPYIVEIARDCVRDSARAGGIDSGDTDTDNASDAANQQLVALKSATMDMIVAENEKLYAEIVHEINTTVMPKVNRLAVGQMYNYMDEQFTTDFRRAAVDQEKTLSITDGTEDKSKYISKYVEKVFGEEDDDC